MMRPFACALVLLLGCDLPGGRGATHPLTEICSDAMPGTECDLLVTEGRPPVVSHCVKRDDGSLVCNSGDSHASAER
jgi:hypothetical protein